MRGPASSHPGSRPGASQEAAGDWNGNSGSNASEGGSVSLSLPVSLSVHPAVLYYCHFRLALTHNHSWHIITFGILGAEIHEQVPKFKKDAWNFFKYSVRSSCRSCFLLLNSEIMLILLSYLLTLFKWINFVWVGPVDPNCNSNHLLSSLIGSP